MLIVHQIILFISQTQSQLLLVELLVVLLQLLYPQRLVPVEVMLYVKVKTLSLLLLRMPQLLGMSFLSEVNQKE